MAIVSLRVGGEGRVRSHFERLCPEDILTNEAEQLRILRAAEAAAANRARQMARAEAERQRAESEKKRDFNTIGATDVATAAAAARAESEAAEATERERMGLDAWYLAALRADWDLMQGAIADSERASRRLGEAAGGAEETR